MVTAMRLAPCLIPSIQRCRTFNKAGHNLSINEKYSAVKQKGEKKTFLGSVASHGVFYPSDSKPL